MTPTNTQKTPEISNIADKNGDKHTVIPTPHTHSQSEVSGLTDALAAKADTSTVNTALAGKADKVSGATNNNFAALDSNGNLKDSGKKPSDFADATSTASALSGKMDNKTIDQEPVEGNATHLISSHGVAMGLKDAISGVITNTILSITLVQDMSGHLLYSSENIISSIKEKSIATAMLEIRKQLDNTLLGKTVVLVSWENSTTVLYKHIYIYTNEAEYNLRKTVADGTWRKLTKTGSSIESYLPE